MSQFICRPAKGYFLAYGSEVDDQDTPHIFCGSSEYDGAECPNCNLPLLQIANFGGSDERLHLNAGFPQDIPLLFCWRCNVAIERFYYRFGLRRITILSYGMGGVETDFPYPDYPLSFPASKLDLIPLTDEQQNTLRGLNSGTIDEWEIRSTEMELCDPRHQLGGEPLLTQRNPELSILCYECNQRMPFFGAFGDDNLDPRGFVGSSEVQMLFFLCQLCSVICGLQQTS